MEANNSEKVTGDNYVDGLVRTLKRASLKTPLTLGVFSEWGGGKEEVMKKLINQSWNSYEKKELQKEMGLLQMVGSDVTWKIDLRCRKVSYCWCVLISYVMSWICSLALAITYCIYEQETNMSDINLTTSMMPLNNPITTTASSPRVIKSREQKTNMSDINMTTSMMPLNNPITTTASSLRVAEILLICIGVFIAIPCLITLITKIIKCCINCQKGSMVCEYCRHFQILFMMLTCESPSPPPPTKVPIIIPIHFSDWHCTGYDNLWGAIITRIMDEVESTFGAWKTRCYRMSEKSQMPSKPRNDDKDVDGSENGTIVPTEKIVTTETYYMIPKPILIGIVISALIASLVLLVAVGIEKNLGLHKDHVESLDDAFWAIGGITLLSVFRYLFLVGRSQYSSQAFKVVKILKEHTSTPLRPDLSPKLGFMKQVIDEVEILLGFINTMERFYQQRFRICLFVDDFSLKPKSQIGDMLDAFSLVLSDENFPIVSVLSIDSVAVLPALSQTDEQDGVCRVELLSDHTTIVPKDQENSSTDVGAVKLNLLKQRIYKKEASIDTSGIARLNRIFGMKFCLPLDLTFGTPSTDNQQSTDKQVKDLLEEEVKTLNGQLEDLCKGSRKEIERVKTTVELVIDLLNSHGLLRILTPSSTSTSSTSTTPSTPPSTVEVDKNKWEAFIIWLYICEFWPYRASWIIKHCSNTEGYSANSELSQIWEKDVKGGFTNHSSTAVSPWSDFEYDAGKFDNLIKDKLKGELRWEQIRQFLPITINLDRSIEKAIRKATHKAEN